MIRLRQLKVYDLEKYHYWQLPFHDYHALNGPYYKKKNEIEIEAMIHELRTQFTNGNSQPLPQKKIISNAANELIGEVSWYWKSEETLWMEIGIVIFDNKFWSKGIGKEAMTLWIQELFDTKAEIVRLGLTTWSGNIGMIKLAEKLHMIKEAEYRNARIVNGTYYDSVSFGILREEWDGIKELS